MSEFPDWAVPGADVLITAHNRFGANHFTAAKILRLTKTRIIVDGGRYERQFIQSKYGEKTWKEYGRSSDWNPTPYLVAGDSDKARELYAEAAKQRVELDAIKACEAFVRTCSPENALTAIDALTTYLEGGQ